MHPARLSPMVTGASLAAVRLRGSGRQTPAGERGLEHEARRVYARAVVALGAAGVPFLVGGAFALERYTGIGRDTKDLDLFVRPGDVRRAVDTLAAAGYGARMVFPHWLAKASAGRHVVDLIFSSGNGVAEVDDDWFAHAVTDRFLGIPVELCPPEEMFWSKAFIMERERYDGADVAHLLQACGSWLDWPRLVARFGEHWRVLLSHLLLFEFVYPGASDAVPRDVRVALLRRATREREPGVGDRDVCRGTLLSRAQYLADVAQRGYRDARLSPAGRLSAADLAVWTAAISAEESKAPHERPHRPPRRRR